MEGNESVDVDPPVAPQPVPVPLPAGTARVLGGEEITAALPIDVDEDAESSDGNWSSGSSFNEDSDDESILTYDTADDESINFVSPKAGRSEWTTSCYSDDKGPFSRPDGEGSWKMDPEASYSDYTLIVVSKETGKQRIYHVHKFTLAHGQCGCEYFAALFRTPCREIVERSSRFTFPTEITNVFPDFLDIVYNPGYMGNVSLFFRRFEGTLYGGNLLPLRGLALYFGCRCLLSNVGKKIKDNINDMHRYNSGGLWATTKLVAALCEDETAEDAQELLGHIVRALVRCFDQFAFNRNKEVLSSIVEAMSPEVLLSLLLQATSTLTNRYRIYACGASIPFTTIVIEYLNANPAITTWQFERIVLYLLDFLQPGFDAIAKIGKELVACGHKRGMYTDFVKRSLKGYVEPSSETVGRLNKVVKTLESTSPHELNPLKIIIEGKYGGNQCSAAVQYGGAELGGNQGNPAFISTQSVPYSTSDNNESGGGLFGGLFAGGQNKKDPAAADPYWNDPNRGILMFEIPLEAMKVGGLRIALSLHCIGQQNTPNKGTWLARQCDDGVIEMWFNNPDQSGMFSITLTELTGGKGTIAVERHGPRPSLVYQLQESLQLHKLLDELETLAFGNDEEVEDENRLLVLKESDGIESARGLLPARQAE